MSGRTLPAARVCRMRFNPPTGKGSDGSEAQGRGTTRGAVRAQARSGFQPEVAADVGSPIALRVSTRLGICVHVRACRVASSSASCRSECLSSISLPVAVAFAAYWLDKFAARTGRWRTAERTLHLFGLVGGWPGALVAQRVFRLQVQQGRVPEGVPGSP